MDTYSQMIKNIIQAQTEVIGPIAVDQANYVEGLSVNNKLEVSLTGDPLKVIDALVEQYKSLFGQISVEVCKEAVGRVAQSITADKLPVSLR